MASKVPGVGVDYDAGAMYAEMIVNLSAGQDVPMAISMAEAKAKAKTMGKSKLTPQDQLKGKLKNGAAKSSALDLEKSALAALIVGMMDKSVKTGIDMAEIRRKMSALKTAKSKLSAVFAEASETVDTSGMKTAAKQQADRIKQEQKKMEQAAGLTGMGLKKYEKLPARTYASMVLASIYTEVSGTPSFGIDQAVAMVNQASNGMADAKQDMADSLSTMLKQVISFTKQMSDAKAQQMQALMRA